MKKAYELSTLTGTQVLLLVVSETGLVYTFTTTKLQPIVTKPEGKNLIQTCLNTPDPTVQDVSILYAYTPLSLSRIMLNSIYRYRRLNWMISYHLNQHQPQVRY